MNDLNEERIRAFVQTQGLSFCVYPTLSSTNVYCKQCGEAGAPEGTVILSQEQTAGKGTRGRSFYSPQGTGLYMSILLRPTLPASAALSITTAAAVAVCRAIERVSARQARIKWVNDVYCDERKVCGILTEASLAADGTRLSQVVLGIGINVNAPKNGFPEDLNGIAGAVFEEKGDRARLAAAVLDAFFALYPSLPSSSVTKEYRERSMLCGRSVTVSTPSGDRHAVVHGVDEQCRLQVCFENGEEAVLSSGDVRIRL